MVLSPLARRRSRGAGLLAVLAVVVAPRAVAAQEHPEHPPWVFEEGPYRRPVPRQGLGLAEAQWPLDSDRVAVQRVFHERSELWRWFTQGHVLMGLGEWTEAEKAFRWCLVLDPECAMAWWQLARSRFERGQIAPGLDLLEQAEQRAALMRPSQRRLVEAWRDAFGRPGTSREAAARLVRSLERRLMELEPEEDLELRVLLAQASRRLPGAYGTTRILAEVLERRPRHPIALAEWIEAWAGLEPQRAVDACRTLGEVASGSAAALHTAATGLARTGRWDEAAATAERALRLERERMLAADECLQDSALFARTAELLGALQLRRGHPDDARALAALLLNTPQALPGDDLVRRCGLRLAVHTAVATGDTASLLDGLPWPEVGQEVSRLYCRAAARLEQGDLEAAQVALDALVAAEAEGRRGAHEVVDVPVEALRLELRGRLRLASGSKLGGIQDLAAAARVERSLRREGHFPPLHPRDLTLLLGRTYLAMEAADKAVECFDRCLALRPADPVVLADWTHACVAAGRIPTRPPVGVEPEVPAVLARREVLDGAPRPAPELAAFDSGSQLRSLDDADGLYTLLVFYLGEDCPLCLEQLQLVAQQVDEFTARGVRVLAISADSPEENLDYESVVDLPFGLLSDPDLANAMRWGVYDEYESLELHATFLIDPQGRLRWDRRGGPPFDDLPFLLHQIDRVRALDQQARSLEAGSSPR